MKMQTRAGWLALGIWAVTSPATAEPETFRCHQPGGGITFQQAPCPLTEMAAPERPATAAPTPRPVPAAALQPGPAAAAAGTDDGFVKPTKRKRDVLELSAQLERCRADVPGFAEKSAAVHAAWGQRHATVLAEYAPLLAAKVRAGRRGEATLPLRLCTDEWLRDMEPLTRAPDPRFNSVEKTWQVFMGALMTGDRATALDCLAGRANSRWKQRVEQMNDEDLRRIAASIRSLKVQWGDDYEKEGVIADTANRVVGIAFRNLNEEWKITDFGAAVAPLPLAP